MPRKQRNYTALPAPRYDVRLEAADGKHTYYVGERKLPGVTGTLDIIGGLKSQRLIGWAKKQALESVRRELVSRFSPPPRIPIVSLTESGIEEILKAASKKPKQVVEEAAAYGTRAHDFINRIILGEKVGEPPEDIRPSVLAFKAWWAKAGIEIVAGDTKVASLEHGYGGSLDWLGRKDGLWVLGDWKTSNSIHDEMALQVAAYWRALRETYDITAQEALIVRFGKTEPNWEVRWIANLAYSFQGFLHAKQLKEILAAPQFA